MTVQQETKPLNSLTNYSQYSFYNKTCELWWVRCPAYLVAVWQNYLIQLCCSEPPAVQTRRRANVQIFTIPLLFLQLHEAQTASHMPSTWIKARTGIVRLPKPSLNWHSPNADTQEVRLWKTWQRQTALSTLSQGRANLIFVIGHYLWWYLVSEVKCCNQLDSEPGE